MSSTQSFFQDPLVSVYGMIFGIHLQEMADLVFVNFVNNPLVMIQFQGRDIQQKGHEQFKNNFIRQSIADQERHLFMSMCILEIPFLFTGFYRQQKPTGF